jgi:Permuted papain-like amidase enzyme, YaeF/YiiX, C92 family
MRIKLLITFLILHLTACAEEAYQPQHCDVVFQSLPNPFGMDLVDMIEGATGSPYSHCGMVIAEQGQWKVIEAIGPVQIIPLAQWQTRGRGKKLWAYRLKDDQKKNIPQVIAAMKLDLGKPYDPRYRLDSEAIYCSELIYRGWKKATNETLGKTVTLQELHWQPYQKIIVAIERTTVIPLDREIITPRDLALASQLEPVWPIVSQKKSK